MKALRVGVLLIILAVGGSWLLGDAVWAQSDPYSNASNLKGVVPFGSYQFGDIDNVNLATGAVNINLPMFMRKGRGVGDGAWADYSSKSWTLERFNNPLNGSYFYQWTKPVIGTGFQSRSPRAGSLELQEDSYECENPPFSGTGHIASVRSNFVYTAPDGTKHRFLNRQFAADVEYNCPPPSGSLVISKSDTGVLELFTPTNNVFQEALTWEVRFKDGRKFTSHGSFAGMRDANGNLGDGRSFNGPAAGSIRDSDGIPRPWTWEYPDPPLSTPTQFPSANCGGWPVFQASVNVRPREIYRLPNGQAFTFTFHSVFGEVVMLPSNLDSQGLGF